MGQKTIDLFMWGYQTNFRGLLEHHARSVFERLGAEGEPKAFLIGGVRPGASDPNPICIEPEIGPLCLADFKDLHDTVRRIVEEHPLQRMRYGDEPSNRDKPERIRRDSLRQAVALALAPLDQRDAMRSFCGLPTPVGHFYVVPVIRVPERVFETHPPLGDAEAEINFSRSLIHAALDVLLEEATLELQRPEPGRSLMGHMKSADEIVRRSASIFMKTPSLLIGDNGFYFDLFEQFNLLSSLFYEGTRSIGRLLLVDPQDPAIDYVLRLVEPVPFRSPRWARKILQMATSEIALIADCEMIYGLGVVSWQTDKVKNAFTIDFLDHYDWQLRRGDQVLVRSRYGVPRLPSAPINEVRFRDTIMRLFSEASVEDADRLWKLLDVAAHQGHGSMLVVCKDAVDEAGRLAQQGTSIVPTLMTEGLLSRVSSIDGTIVLDPHGVCHAIGVILDGPARPECSPARGSRYNSAIRYVGAGTAPRVAIVVSDDHTVDVLPMLRPRVSRKVIAAAIEALARASLDDYHAPRKWLDEHRFYLNAAQCELVNVALDRIEKLPKEVGELVIITERFDVDPGQDDEYLFE